LGFFFGFSFHFDLLFCCIILESDGSSFLGFINEITNAVRLIGRDVDMIGGLVKEIIEAAKVLQFGVFAPHSHP
jgi:hypothetical protein